MDPDTHNHDSSKREVRIRSTSSINESTLSIEPSRLMSNVGRFEVSKVAPCGSITSVGQQNRDSATDPNSSDVSGNNFSRHSSDYNTANPRVKLKGPKGNTYILTTGTNTTKAQLQLRVFQWLEHPRGKLPNIYHTIVFFAVLTTVVLSIVEGDPFNLPSLSSGYIQMQWVLFLIFLSEYTLRSWSCGIVSAYSGLNRIRFLIRPSMIIDLVILLFSCTEVIFSCFSHERNRIDLENFMLIMRIVQVLRLLHFERFHNAINSLLRVLHTHRYELLTAFVVMIIIIIFFSYVIYIVETKYRADGQTGQIKSLFESFYFVVITFLTIGYGDFVPTSGAGRLITALISLVGVAIVSLPTNIIGSGFALYVNQRGRKRHKSSKYIPAVKLIQRWWRTKCPHLENSSPIVKSELDAYNRYRQKMNFFYNELESDDFEQRSHLIKTHRPNTTVFEKHVPQIVELKDSHTSQKQTGPNPFSPLQSCPGGTQSLTFRSLANWFINDTREKARKAKLASADLKEFPLNILQAMKIVRLINYYLSWLEFANVKKPYDSVEMMEEFSKSQLYLSRSLEIVTTKVEMLLSRNFRNHQQMQADIRNISSQLTLLNERLSKIERFVHQPDRSAILEVSSNGSSGGGGGGSLNRPENRSAV